ncbi:cell wall hydrolase [Afifella pfennigii]|uniref:cell wall hydrolase n=1 Tax=Afifella pfennigii TaxID=209897 RepID=UPI0009FC5400
MFVSRRFRRLASWLTLGTALALAGCGSAPKRMSSLECMQRAMYFESNRSSDEGMLAVGTVVMNRVKSKDFPNDVCAVVGQKNQFAKGLLSKPMTDSGRPRAQRMAKEVLRGKRHPGVGEARFFHTAGYSFPYSNMHYVLMAGGNSFYVKRKALPGRQNRPQEVVIAAAKAKRSVPREAPQAKPRAPIMVADTRSRAPAAPSRQVVFAPAAPVQPRPAPVLAAMPAPAPAPRSIEELIALN